MPSIYRTQARKVVLSLALQTILTPLELVSVSSATLIDYTSRIIFFVRWSQQNDADWTNATELDYYLVNCFNELFASQVSAAEGSKLLAALRFFLPALVRSGVETLPRATRGLRAWNLRRPLLQRTPFPWLCLTAVLGVLCSGSGLVSALSLLLQFHTYLRPGVNDALLVSQLIRPAAIAGVGFQLWGVHLYPHELLEPGKTRGYDEAVLIDGFDWLHPFLELLVSDRPGSDLLWPTTPAMIRRHFKLAVDALGLGILQPCRYSLRHGGASHDILSRKRSLLEVKHRGHWRSENSLLRYGKPTKILQHLNLVSPQVLEYGKYVSLNLEAVFHQDPSVRPPPVSMGL